MRIDISGQAFDEIRTLRDYVSQRLLIVLSRYGRQVVRARVCLIDCRKGADETHLQCRLTISLVSGRKIQVEGSASDLYLAIDRSVERAGRLVSLALGKTGSTIPP